MWIRSLRKTQGEYPRLVAVETTNHCNAVCHFCPNNALARNKRHMSDALFEKIIEDCREFPLPAIEPFLQGEPFSDPKIIERMEHIRRRLPKTKLRLYTNGYALTPKKIDRLMGLGIDHLYVSLNTLDPERYRRLMGFKLERTLENLAYLTDPRRRNQVARRITFRATRTADMSLEEQDRFIAYCRARKVRPYLCGLFNYKGDIASDLPVPDYPCIHIDRLDILASGRVTLCCMDQDGEYAWGDVSRHSVLEVYRGAVAARYRRLHRSGRRREAEPCGRCTLFWPSLRGLGPLAFARTVLGFGVYLLRHRPVGRQPPRRRPVVVNAGKLEAILTANEAARRARRRVPRNP